MLKLQKFYMNLSLLSLVYIDLCGLMLNQVKIILPQINESAAQLHYY